MPQLLLAVRLRHAENLLACWPVGFLHGEEHDSVVVVAMVEEFQPISDHNPPTLQKLVYC